MKSTQNEETRKVGPASQYIQGLNRARLSNETFIHLARLKISPDHTDLKIDCDIGCPPTVEPTDSYIEPSVLMSLDQNLTAEGNRRPDLLPGSLVLNYLEFFKHINYKILESAQDTEPSSSEASTEQSDVDEILKSALDLPPNYRNSDHATRGGSTSEIPQ